MGKLDAFEPLRTTALRALRWSALRNWISQLISIGVVMVLARLLSPGEFGVYAIASACTFIAVAVSDQGFTTTLIQRESIDETDVHTVFWATQIIAVIFVLLIAATSRNIAEIFSSPELGWLLPALALSIPIMAATGVMSASLTRKLDFKSIASASVYSAVFGSVIAVITALMGFGLWSFVAQTLTGSLVGLALFATRSGFRPEFSFSLERLRKLWSFSLFALAGDLLGQVSHRIPVLIIGAQLSVQNVGMFSVGRRFVELGQQAITAPITQVTIPTVAKMQSNPERAQKVFLNGLQIVASLVCPIMICGMIFSDQAVAILLGDQWSGAGTILAILAFAGIFECFHWFCMSTTIALGRADLRLRFVIINAFAIICSVVVAAPMGLQAVAVALAGRALVLTPVALLITRLALPMSFRDLTTTVFYIIPALGFLSVVAVSAEFLTSDWHAFTALAAGCLAAATVYCLAIRITAPDLFYRLMDIIPVSLKPKFLGKE